ncbi:ABC transporter ATP-binding protein [Uliginosibacterium sp. H1]|uniref:ABC transporter ATP-binding protein n=1 Tax=Uliginosibacterium sp. H1 TaxID=3114757 RepID=UPI002E17D096|nr:ABC transporter ATP-binding protein [Uliginosibacterium sp. H1]
MSSDQVAVSVRSVSKRYDLYGKPSDQLRQYIYPRIQRLLRLPGKNYYNEFWALSDVSFDIRKGESFGIVGRNGSGKSTLLQIIAGTLSPTSGEVATSGRLAALLELGSGFDPDFTGRENIYMNGALLGMTREEVDVRFDAIARFADIGQFLDQPLKSYSSGMVVRLAVAVQTQIEPDILIIDEALAVGDALFQKRCFRQLQRLLDNGCTLLFVSHDQEIVRSLTTRAIFLSRGETQLCGATRDVMVAYRESLQREEEAVFASLQTAMKPVSPGTNEEAARGSEEVQIVSTRVLDAFGLEQAVFQSGDLITIEISLLCHVDIENLNVAFRIRTKEGVKVSTWGTLNEDMPLFSGNEPATFWARRFKKGERVVVQFRGPCALGGNLYEVQAIVAQEFDRYYADQRVLHWVEDAAHFTVVLKAREYVFDGVCDTGLRCVRDWLPEPSVIDSSFYDFVPDGRVSATTPEPSLLEANREVP